MKKVSVIIPTYNEEKRISKCLRSIFDQKYPKNNIEVLIIDDVSIDNTVKISRKFGCRVLKNGTHNIERAKSIGIKYSKGKYCLFVDADNTLIDPFWIKKAVSILDKHKDVAAVQSESFYFSTNHSLVTQYCDLFGINDPLAYYLGKRGQKMQINERFPKQGRILLNNPEYSIVIFSKSTLPPIGSQGYLVRKSLIKKTNWTPYMFHIDTAYQLVEKGINKFSYLKSPVEHEYAESIADMKKKLQRNLLLFLEQSSMRVYKYNINIIKIVYASILMVSIVHPLFTSLKLFYKNPQKAWFLHPILCFLQIFWYLEIYLKYYFKSKFKYSFAQY